MDNYIYIDSKLRIWDCSASRVFALKKGRISQKDLEKQKIRKLAQAETLGEAVKLAEEFESEYGLHFELWCK